MRYKMTIEPITFIHIGSGREIDIFNYTIIDNTFYRINISNFYEILIDKDKKKFEEIIDKISKTSPQDNNYIDNRKELLEFLESGIKNLEKNPEKQKGIILYKSNFDEDFGNKYKTDLSKTDLIKADSQFIISEAMHRLPDYKPYIPGSSIKGAIRTALISYIINKLNLQRTDFNFQNYDYKKNPGKYVEKNILNYNETIQNDPFRILQISDTEGYDYNSLTIKQTYNYNKKNNSVLSINILNEYIMFNNAIKFHLIINEKLLGDGINNHSKFDSISKKIGIRNNISNTKDIFKIEVIKNACNEFYTDKLNNEYKNYFRNINQNLNIIAKENIEQRVNKDNNEFLIRIGRFSQYESMTLDNLREKDNYKFNSRMLVKYDNQYYPVGWAKIKYEEM
ncbi:MAG: type III-A CRISPR-associated RAMP protein Csm5 [Exilispira sp.]